MLIKASALTVAAFAPYGQVLAASGAAAERQPYAANMDNRRPAARANMTFMKLAPTSGPRVRVTALERHVYSNQLFVPLGGCRHLVAVCPSNEAGEPLLERLEVFVAEGSQAINYNPNVWHAPRMPLSAPGEFVMFRWDEDNELDTEMRTLEVAIDVELPDAESTTRTDPPPDAI